MSDDPHDLARFVSAQSPVWQDALAELTDGCKRTHWMWFVFPQLKGLGVSSTARFYGIASLDEAWAYLAHPVLGCRLADATCAVLAYPGRSAHAIFGSPDDLKFRSSMTLFSIADPTMRMFSDALTTFFDGEADARTRALLDTRA